MPPARLVVAALAVALTSTTCGSSTSGADEQIATLAEELLVESDGVLSEAEARCVAEEVVAAFEDPDELDRLLRRAARGRLDDDFRSTVATAFVGCGAVDTFTRR